MRAVLSLARRESASLFLTGAGWVIAAAFALLASSTLALTTLRPGEPATMRSFFELASILQLAICPAISMRALAEEFRTGSAEWLRSQRIGDAGLAVGKYLGCLLGYLGVLAPTIVLPITIAIISEPGPAIGPIVTGYLALILTGGVYLAAGLLASSITSSQTTAFLAAFLGLLAFQLVTTQGVTLLPEAWRTVAAGLSVPVRIGALAKGVIDLGDIVYFIALATVLVTLSWIALEVKRWR